ncbi:MAG: cupin domain-containing protein [Cyanobacteria bacterium Co-bin8]|nr:cupin domain-containing protein [Cyanobacteria bacterium Co-bin8]
MTAQVLSRPKVLLAGEGETSKMLSHTFTKKVDAAETNGDWVMVEVTDVAGFGAPLHTHPWYEVFYILEGELELQVGNRKVQATAGSTLYVPENCAHDFTIVSPSVRFLVMIPAYAEAFYRETSEKITSLPPNAEVFQEICIKHGVQLIQK